MPAAAPVLRPEWTIGVSAVEEVAAAAAPDCDVAEEEYKPLDVAEENVAKVDGVGANVTEAELVEDDVEELAMVAVSKRALCKDTVPPSDASCSI